MTKRVEMVRHVAISMGEGCGHDRWPVYAGGLQIAEIERLYREPGLFSIYAPGLGWPRPSFTSHTDAFQWVVQQIRQRPS